MREASTGSGAKKPSGLDSIAGSPSEAASPSTRSALYLKAPLQYLVDTRDMGGQPRTTPGSPDLLHHHGTFFCHRDIRRHGDSQSFQRVASRAGILSSATCHLQKVSELGLVGVLESHHESRVCHLFGRRSARFYGT